MAIIELEKIVISKKGEIEKKEFFSKNYVKNYFPVYSAGTSIKGYYKFKNRTKNIICISSSGANAGYISIPTTDFFAADCFTLEAKDKTKILQKYLNYKILTMKNFITDSKEGSAQSHVYFKNIAKFKIILPKIVNQKSIIEIIEQNEKLFLKYSNCVRIDNFQNVKNDMKNLIEIIEPIQNQINLIKKLKNSILKMFECYSYLYSSSNEFLINYVDFEKGKSLNSKEFKENGNTPFLDVKSLVGNISKYVMNEKNTNFGEILLALDGTPGRISYSCEGFNGYVYNVKSNLLSKAEIFFNCLHYKNQKIIKLNAIGTTIAHASKAKDKMFYFKIERKIIDNYFKTLLFLEKINIKQNKVLNYLINLLIK